MENYNSAKEFAEVIKKNVINMNRSQKILRCANQQLESSIEG